MAAGPGVGDKKGEDQGGEEGVPRDAKLVKSILRSMGVKQHEPRVVHQFLDFWYRYVVEVLTDAQLYSEHAGKPLIDRDDLKLAIQSRLNFSFSQPPSRETLLELASSRNSVPLPKAINGPGIALPPEADTLTAQNYQLVVPTKQSNQVEEMEVDDGDKNQAATSSGIPPSSVLSAEQDISKKVTFSLAGKRPRS